MANNNLKQFTDDNFDAEVKKDTGLVLVDFWATWCGPCRIIGPMIEELAGVYAGKVKMGKMSTEENQTVPSSLGILAIPTIVLFKGGEEVDRVTGAVTKEKFKEMIDKALG